MLKPSVTFALSPDHLMKLVRDADDRGQRLVIDCPSFNPLDEADMKRCSDLISYMNVEPVLVLAPMATPWNSRTMRAPSPLAGCKPCHPYQDRCGSASRGSNRSNFFRAVKHRFTRFDVKCPMWADACFV
jgi:hypothetical protein